MVPLLFIFAILIIAVYVNFRFYKFWRDFHHCKIAIEFLRLEDEPEVEEAVPFFPSGRPELIHQTNIPTPEILRRRYILPLGEELTPEAAVRLTTSRGDFDRLFPYPKNTVFKDPEYFMLCDTDFGNGLLVSKTRIQCIQCEFRPGSFTRLKKPKWIAKELGLKYAAFKFDDNSEESCHFASQCLSRR